ncbi:hypothetical protein [uncultured Gelidibacter sp.]|uniref:hypothetical protein n=1 Tax=uncultured Gelidibacter sp. TaxID=259318 RepID=UPI00262617D4|nr:hypothetical protein [uncultured Gelidibacter sp.]
MKQTKHFLVALTLGLTLASCSKDEAISADPASADMNENAVYSRSALPATTEGNITWEIPGLKAQDFSFKYNNLVEPSECGATPFNSVTAYYNNALIEGFISSWDFNRDAIGVILEDYFTINQIAALIGKNTDTFGAEGEYTAYVQNRVRSLEKFWNMSDLISVRGQHTSTLEDLDFIRFIYENFSEATPDQVDYLVGIANHFNTTSDQIPENPFYASDGFATSSGVIVIGDGIVSMLAETGLDPKVVWSGILAHEWGHQIQFQNYGNWEYPVPAFIGTPESTRMTELEADFLTGYYLTHKRGGTYNWKRVEDVLLSFYNIGDCGFESSGHHGTPLQRLEAARQGYILAASQQKAGHISEPQAIHDAFIEKLPSIIGGAL